MKPKYRPDIRNLAAGRPLALLLPGYSPDLAWIGLTMVAGCVILDDLHPFSRKSRVHRVKIRTPDGHQWLTIPFVSDDRNKPIRQVRIDSRRPWLKNHLQALKFNYRNSLYFDYYEPEIQSDLESAAECEFLIDAVRLLTRRQWTYLQRDDFPMWASEHFESHDDLYDHITSQTEIVWQEPGSRNYQKPHPSVIPSVISLPEYRQHFPGFVPGCGLLDLIFEYGPEAWQVLDELPSGAG